MWWISKHERSNILIPADNTDHPGACAGNDKRGTDFNPATVGNLSLSMSKYEGEVVSTGTLTMNGIEYKVLLTSPAKLGRW